MEKKDNEVHSAVSFFSKRAKLVAKVTAEDLKATSELLNKMQAAKPEVALSEKNGPQPVKKPARKTARGGKQKEASPEPEVIGNDNTDNIPVSPEKLPAAAVRRLKKLQREKNLELQRMDAENEKIFSALKSSEYNEVEEVEAGPVEDFENMNVLTVSYLSQISRLKCSDVDKFSTIFPKVAESFKLKVSEFLLSFKEKIISVDDTPKSLNLTDSDILECIPYKKDEICDSEIQYDENNLKITFQANDSKAKIDMVVHKLEKMQEIMEKYSKQRNIPLKLLSFEFDGETLSGTETPEELDMESGNCVDVTVLTPAEEEEKKKANEEKKTADDETVVFVDSDSNDSDIVCVADW